MIRRLFALCLLTYPRAQRQADGAFLIDLAIELSERHGSVHQAWSLVSGGIAERFRKRRESSSSWSPRRRWSTLALGIAAVVAVIAGLAAFGSTDTEVEVRSCVDASATGCADLVRLSAERESQGWDCTTKRHLVGGRQQTDLECRRVA